MTSEENSIDVVEKYGYRTASVMVVDEYNCRINPFRVTAEIFYKLTKNIKKVNVTKALYSLKGSILSLI
jgi:hypothetical protein